MSRPIGCAGNGDRRRTIDFSVTGTITLTNGDLVVDGSVTSIITTGSVQRMNLKEGDHVFAMIKATEVSVSVR